MATGDKTALLILGAISVPIGLLIALLVRRSRHPFLWTAVGSGFGATVAALIVVCVMQTAVSMTDYGYSIGNAVQSGLAAAFILGFAMPVVSGGPAALLGLAVQCLLQRSCRRCRREPPPPLPDVIP
jgi:hypothetical protein